MWKANNEIGSLAKSIIDAVLICYISVFTINYIHKAYKEYKIKEENRLFGCDGIFVPIFVDMLKAKQNQFPLKVYSKLNSSYYEQALINAINTWNKALGKNVLVYSYDEPTRENLDVLVEFGNEEFFMERPLTHGVTIPAKLDNHQYAPYSIFIIILKTTQTADPESLLLHELGHVLGYQHEIGDNRVNTMNVYLDNEIRREVAGPAKKALKCLHNNNFKIRQNSLNDYSLLDTDK